MLFRRSLSSSACALSMMSRRQHGNNSVHWLSSRSLATATGTTTTTTPSPPAAAASFERIALIGAGKMAHAILKPLIGQHIQPANQICVYDVSPASMERIADEYPGVATSQTIPEALHHADLVLLCVKPQNLTESFFDQVCKSALHPTKDAILLSIVAGKPISFLIESSRDHFSKVVRSMPNTPAMIGQGMTVWSATANLSTEERNKIKKILSGFGKAVRTLHMFCLLLVACCSFSYCFIYTHFLVASCFLLVASFRKPTIDSLSSSSYIYIYNSYTWTMNPLLTWPRVFPVLVQPIYSCSWKA